MKMLTITEGPSREELFDSIRRSINVFFSFLESEVSGGSQVFSVKRVLLNDDENNHFWYIGFSVGFKGEAVQGKPYHAYYSTANRKGFVVEKELSFELVKSEKHHCPLSTDELCTMLWYFKISPTSQWNAVHVRLDKAIPNYPLTEDVMRRQKRLPLLLVKIKKSKD